MSTPTTGTGDFTASIATIPADVIIAQELLAVVGASSSVTYGPFAMTSPAYAITVDALVNVAATISIFTVVMQWTDPTTGLVVAYEKWHCQGNSHNPAIAGNLTFGRGPTKAGNLTITVTNWDTLQAMTLDLVLWQSSRQVTRDDWRYYGPNGAFVNWAVPNLDPAAGLLGFKTTMSIPAAGNGTFLCALYAGQAELFYQLSSTANVTVWVFSPTPDLAAPPYPTQYFQLAPPATNTLYLSLPRCPVVVEFQNASGAGITGQWCLTIQEFAS